MRLRLAGASVPHQISVRPEVGTFQQTHPATALVYQHERVNTGGLSPVRLRYGFCRVYKPVLDDAPWRSFNSMAEYRDWCEAHLPSYVASSIPSCFNGPRAKVPLAASRTTAYSFVMSHHFCLRSPRNWRVTMKSSLLPVHFTMVCGLTILLVTS